MYNFLHWVLQKAIVQGLFLLHIFTSSFTKSKLSVVFRLHCTRSGVRDFDILWQSLIICVWSFYRNFDRMHAVVVMSIKTTHEIKLCHSVNWNVTDSQLTEWQNFIRWPPPPFPPQKIFLFESRLKVLFWINQLDSIYNFSFNVNARSWCIELVTSFVQ